MSLSRIYRQGISGGNLPNTKGQPPWGGLPDAPFERPLGSQSPPVLSLAFDTQPTSGFAKFASPLDTIVVHALRDGELDTSYSGNVTLSLGDGDGALYGTVTVSAVNGVATYTTVGNATYNAAMTLIASASGHTSAESDPIALYNAKGIAGECSAYRYDPATTVVRVDGGTTYVAQLGDYVRGKTAFQASEALQPVLADGPRGRKVIVGDGTNWLLTETGWSTLTDQKGFICVYGRNTAEPSVFCSGGGTGEARILLDRINSNGSKIRFYTASNIISTTTADGDDHTYTANKTNPSTGVLRQDGVQIGSGSPGSSASATDRMALMALSVAGGTLLQGQFEELIVGRSTLSGAEITAIEAYQAA